MGKDEKKSRANPLTGLAAALVKSGHMKEKDARELQREQRKEEKALGRDGVAEREAHKAAEAEARRKAEAEAQRLREQERTARAARERATQLTLDNLHPGAEGGQRRWFFVARDGRVPFLELSDDAGRMLYDGKAGIVELLDPATGRVRHVVVAGDKHLVTLSGIDKELVRFWNRGGPPEARP